MSLLTETNAVKNKILNFLKFQVSKSVYNAINYLLSPCCETSQISTIAITNLTIKGVPVLSQKIKVIILTEGGIVQTSGFASGTVDINGDLTITA